MHPLLDRRDVTAQRQAEAPPDRGRSTGDEALITVAQAIRKTNELLQALLVADRLVELCVTDREPAEFLMRNFPVPGANRLIVRRPGAGGTFTLAAGTPTLILTANENRLGGLIVNAGTGIVTLYLAVDLLEPGSSTPLTAGAPQIFLPPGNPGTATGAVSSWPLLLGRRLWCGNVVAIAGTGGTSVTVAEV